MDDLYGLLLNRLSGVKSIVFMGIGEEKLSDDGVGPYIISELLPCSDTGLVPGFRGNQNPVTRRFVARPVH